MITYQVNNMSEQELKKLEDKLWAAADKMRGAVSVSDYKFIVLGMIFLKYISDSFEEKYKELVDEGAGLEEERDCYTAENIFYVPKNARWEYLVEHSKDTNIGEIIDDALIVSDVVVMQMMKDLKIKAELHVSTQASSLNYEVVNFYKELGATRVVLAREAHKSDIERIKKETGIEIECFVHGAMCTAVSGRCVLSNYATLRDSNRGGCVQACRFIYDIDSTDQVFSMTPKDLNMVPFIDHMIDAGVFSFKIEGRMRSIYYVSTVILIYRRLLDKIKNGTLTDEYKKYATNILNRVANRESTPQFFDKLPGVDEQYYLGRQEESNQDFLGLVLDYKDGVATIEQRNFFKLGDTVTVFGPGIKDYTFKITEIINEDGEKIEQANHPKEPLKIKISKKIPKNSMIRVSF